MIKAYIATALERIADHNALRDVLLADRVHLTYDWTLHGAVWEGGSDRIRSVSILEMDGVRTADVVIVLLPGGRGTHTELGMALAFGKPVLIHAVDEARLCFGPAPQTCAFYHHPLCSWHVGTWKQLSESVYWRGMEVTSGK